MHTGYCISTKNKWHSAISWGYLLFWHTVCRPFTQTKTTLQNIRYNQNIPCLRCAITLWLGMWHNLNSHTNETQFVGKKSSGFVLYFWRVFICFLLEKSRPWWPWLICLMSREWEVEKFLFQFFFIQHAFRIKAWDICRRTHIKSSKLPKMQSLSNKWKALGYHL